MFTTGTPTDAGLNGEEPGVDARAQALIVSIRATKKQPIVFLLMEFPSVESLALIISFL
jgi:hypothetical protein